MIQTATPIVQQKFLITKCDVFADYDKDYKDILGSNKLPVWPLEAPEIDVVHYTKKDLQQIIQLVFQAQISKKRSSGDKLKVRSPDVYCGRSQIECYNFCQIFKDHFATVEATRLNQILFATPFLWDQIDFCCQKHQQKLDRDSLFLIIWNKFKAFFRGVLKDCQAFVNSYWAKIKRNS